MPPTTSTPPRPVDLNLGRRSNLLTLRFLDPELERRYLDSQLNYRLIAARVSFLGAASLWALFALLNALTIKDPSDIYFVVRTIGSLGNLAGFALSFLLAPGHWMRPTFLIWVGMNTVFLTLALVFMGRDSLPYYPPTAIFMLAAVASITLCGFTFTEGMTLAAFSIGCFLYCVTIARPETPLEIVYHASWVIGVINLAGIGSYSLDRQLRIAWLRQIDLANAETRVLALLHNVLPPSIAIRKLSGERVIADDFASASLLFADVVGFTELSSRLTSIEVVTTLSQLFSSFDAIVALHGLEKIKTIGDCYMVAAGIPLAQPDHLSILARAALEMLAAARNVRLPDGRSLQVRIGMHTGAVTAGVIGDAKFIFDVWGDTVNVASRLESHGVANQIQVSDAVRAALGDLYVFDGPRQVNLKGKGPISVWTLREARKM